MQYDGVWYYRYRRMLLGSFFLFTPNIDDDPGY
jgi:hypothetical protein